MNKDEIDKIIKQIDERLTLHNIVKEPIPSDLDKAIKLSVAYEYKEQILNKLKKWLRQEIKKQNNISKNNLSKLPTNREKILTEVLNKIESLERSDNK